MKKSSMSLIILIGFFCQLSKPSPAITSPLDTSAIDQASNVIVFKNRCKHPLKLAVHYQNLQGQWVTRSWYDYRRGQSGTPNGVQTNNRYFYYYAEATDGSGITWGGTDTSIMIDGRYYNMRKMDIGKYITEFNHSLYCCSEGAEFCPGYREYID